MENNQNHQKNKLDWTDIDEEFTEEIAQKWTENEFGKKQCQKWAYALDSKFDVNNYDFYAWLRDEKEMSSKRLEKLSKNKINKLIEEYHNKNIDSESSEEYDDQELDWTDIDKGFAFDKEEDDYNFHREVWIAQKFNYQKTKAWIQAGVKFYEPYFAAHLEKIGYQPTNPNITEIIKKKFANYKYNAENYLNLYYPQEKRKNIKKLIYIGEKLLGSLNLNDFVNLEELNCQVSQITLLDLSNCEELKKIHCESCDQLTSETLFLPKQGKKLISLDLSGCKIKDLSILSHFENLEEINLAACSELGGNLEPLRKLKKLKYLAVSKSNLDPTWEHLSSEINLMKRNKVMAPNSGYFREHKALLPYQENDGKNYNLQKWRRNQKGYKWLEDYTLF